MKRLFWIFFILCLLILASFALFGDTFDRLFSSAAMRDLLAEHRQWAGPIGAGLLIADLILPVPTTVIIGAMGAVLGATAAALWGWAGLTLAGLLGFALARLGERRWADRLASPAERDRSRAFFDQWGGLAVVLGRMLPILPEALSITAGLSGMRPRHFVIAVTLGSIPPAIAFAWIGEKAVDSPGPAFFALVLLMALFWLAYRKLHAHFNQTQPRLDE